MFTSRMMSCEPRFLHVHRSHGAEPDLECRTSRLHVGTMRSVGIFALSGSDSLQRARRSARRLAGRRARRTATDSALTFSERLVELVESFQVVCWRSQESKGRLRNGGRRFEACLTRYASTRVKAHLRPQYAKRLAAEKKAGGSGWDTIKWKQNLYELMNIEIARSNYAMLMERTLPPMAA